MENLETLQYILKAKIILIYKIITKVNYNQRELLKLLTQSSAWTIIFRMIQNSIM